MSPSEIASLQIELANLASSKKPAVRARVAASPYASAAILHLLSKDRSGNVKEAVAANPNTPAEIIKALFKSTSAYAKQGLADNPALDASQLLILAKTRTNQALWNLANNKSSTAEVLEQAYKSVVFFGCADYVKHGIAIHPNASEGLRREIQDSSSYLAQNLAEDADAPPELLAMLVKHIDYYVVKAAITNERADKAVLLLVATKQIHSSRLGDHKELCEAIFERKVIPTEVLQVLAKDDEPEIRLEALNRLAQIEGASKPVPVIVSNYVAPPMDVILTKEEVLKELLNSGYEKAKAALAEEVRKAEEVERNARRKAVQDCEDCVVLLGMASDPDPIIRKEVATKQSIRKPQNEVAEKVALLLAKDLDFEVRQCLRQFTRSPKICAVMAADERVEIRRGVASDPWASEETRQLLVRDPDPEVRLQAALRIGTVPAAPAAPVKKEEPKSYAVPMMLGSGMIAGMLLNGLGSLAKNQVRVPSIADETIETAIEAVQEATA